ncbi:MAG: (d)CMP kinase [Proteobacteria bacterium]|nr:(d)CMP kinase [Pseudomonadota bacterium]
MTQRLLIAIDGPSSSGKGTIARKIAEHFNLPYLNTGALYRGVAYKALEHGFDLESDESKILPLIKELDLSDLESIRLHNEEVGKSASIIAKNQTIRDGLFQLQKDFIVNGLKNHNGAVLDGRDIGTVICPEADYKFFITASAEERANRRYKQLTQNGKDVNYEEILQRLKDRDEQDKNRTISPLKKADDALEIETSALSIEQVFQTCINNIKTSNENVVTKN